MHLEIIFLVFLMQKKSRDNHFTELVVSSRQENDDSIWQNAQARRQVTKMTHHCPCYDI